VSELHSDENFVRPNEKAPSETVEPVPEHLRSLNPSCDTAHCHNPAAFAVQTFKKGPESLWVYFCPERRPDNPSSLRDLAETRITEETALVEGFLL
jgi:hypothetical protein